MSFLDFKTKNLPADLASGTVSALVAIPDAIALILLFSRTRLKNFSLALAMVIGTAAWERTDW